MRNFFLTLQTNEPPIRFFLPTATLYNYHENREQGLMKLIKLGLITYSIICVTISQRKSKSFGRMVGNKLSFEKTQLNVENIKKKNLFLYFQGLYFLNSKSSSLIMRKAYKLFKETNLNNSELGFIIFTQFRFAE